MSTLDPEQTKAEIARLEAKRRASVGMGVGYRDRVAAIDAQLAKLKETQP